MVGSPLSSKDEYEMFWIRRDDFGIGFFLERRKPRFV